LVDFGDFRAYRYNFSIGVVDPKNQDELIQCPMPSGEEMKWHRPIQFFKALVKGGPRRPDRSLAIVAVHKDDEMFSPPWMTQPFTTDLPPLPEVLEAMPAAGEAELQPEAVAVAVPVAVPEAEHETGLPEHPDLERDEVETNPDLG